MDPRTRELVKLSAAAVIVDELARSQAAIPDIQKEAKVNKGLIALLALLGLGGAGAASALTTNPGQKTAPSKDVGRSAPAHPGGTFGWDDLLRGNPLNLVTRPAAQPDRLTIGDLFNARGQGALRGLGNAGRSEDGGFLNRLLGI